jgi:hypothetical protein
MYTTITTVPLHHVLTIATNLYKDSLRMTLYDTQRRHDGDAFAAAKSRKQQTALEKACDIYQTQRKEKERKDWSLDGDTVIETWKFDFLSGV